MTSSISENNSWGSYDSCFFPIDLMERLRTILIAEIIMMNKKELFMKNIELVWIEPLREVSFIA